MLVKTKASSFQKRYEELFNLKYWQIWKKVLEHLWLTEIITMQNLVSKLYWAHVGAYDYYPPYLLHRILDPLGTCRYSRGYPHLWPLLKIISVFPNSNFDDFHVRAQKTIWCIVVPDLWTQKMIFAKNKQNIYYYFEN